jgi:hypothetical protein
LDRNLIFILLLFAFLFVAIFVFHFYKVRSYYSRLKDYCYANQFKLTKRPEKNVKFQITGTTRNHPWVFKCLIEKPEGFAGINPSGANAEIASYFLFSSPGIKINNMFIIGKSDMLSAQDVEFDENVIGFFLKNVLGEATAKKLKDIVQVDFGKTEAFKFQYMTLAHEKARPGDIIDEEIEEVLTNQFEWVSDNDITITVLPDRLEIRADAKEDSDNIKSVIELGTKILRKV